MPNDKILLNFDPDCEQFFMESLNGDYENLTQKAVDYLEKYYKGNVGDILFCTFCQTSVTPSAVFTDRAQKSHQKLENGIPVNYEDHPALRPTAIATEEYGVCITEVWIKHCNKIGIRPWLSVRMNDHHCWKEETSFLRSDFYYKAKEKGWLLGEKYRSAQNDFDYGVPEVRRQMLSYIKEQLTRYDVYGLELDFMREPKCVRFYDDENASSYLTEFMRQTKRVIAACEAIHGHPIKLAVRLPRDLALSGILGFDVLGWAREGLLDVVIPSSHWPGVDTGMPIADWVEKLSPHGVDVCACMEMNLPHKLYTDLEVAKAHTAQYHAQGSKQTYVYNLYHPFLGYINDLDMWAIPAPNGVELAEIWSTCGDVAKCRRGVRRHILTEESPAFDYLRPHWQPLPRAVGEGASFEIQTGPIGERAELTLFLGVNGGELSSVCVNGRPCTLLAESGNAHILKNPEISPEQIRAYRVPTGTFGELVQALTVTAAPDTELFYVELLVDEQ